MTGGDATATGAIFEHERVAAGLRLGAAVPPPRGLRAARARTGSADEAHFRRALDVGCGTGMSSVALSSLAGEVVGHRRLYADARATRGERQSTSLRSRRGGGLPFRQRRLRPRGRLRLDRLGRPSRLPAAGRRAAGQRRLARIARLRRHRAARPRRRRPGAAGTTKSSERALPAPAGERPRHRSERSRALPASKRRHWSDFASLCARSPRREYAAFLMTESNVIAAIEYGGAAESEVRGWLEPAAGAALRRRPSPHRLRGLRPETPEGGSHSLSAPGIACVP